MSNPAHRRFYTAGEYHYAEDRASAAGHAEGIAYAKAWIEALAAMGEWAQRWGVDRPSQFCQRCGVLRCGSTEGALCRKRNVLGQTHVWA